MNPIELRISNEPVATGGYARLTLVGAAEPKPEALKISIQRGEESNPFLGPSGWQSSEHYFEVSKIEVEAADLVVILGPDIVDQVEDYTLLQFSFPEIDAMGVVSWEGVTASIGGLTGGGIGGGKTEAIDVPSKGPNQGLETQIDVKDNSKTDVPNDQDKAGTDVDQVEDPQPLPPPPPPPGPQSKPVWLWPVIGVVLLGLGVGAWFLFGDSGDPVNPEEDPVAEAPQGPEPESEPEPELDEESELARLHREGVEALGRNQCDVAKSKLEQSLAGEYGPSILLWAEETDSLDFRSCLASTRDDVRSARYYKQACEKDVDGAKPAFEAWNAELTKRSDRGDVTAGEVIRLFVADIEAACE